MAISAIIAPGCVRIENHRSCVSTVRPHPPGRNKVLTRKLRRPIVGLAACVLVGSAFVASPAAAAPSAGDPSFAPSALASKLDSQFGSRTAGSYLDATGKVVINVTDAAPAPAGPGAGAPPRFVAHTGTEIAAAHDSLTANLKTPGTAFAVDPTT